MILHALHDLYDRFENDESYDVAPDGYSLQKTSFVIVLDADPEGRLKDFELIDYRKGRERCQPGTGDIRGFQDPSPISRNRDQ